MIITLDGPAASGKSTVAQMLARDLRIMYLNTGLLYRAFAYCLVHERSYNQAMLASPSLQDIDFVMQSSFIRYDYDLKQGALLYYKHENIVGHLKRAEVDQWASIVSADAGVRQALLQMQRDLGQEHDLVVEGRDCGSVVFPHAEFKFYMTAALETRALRWQADQKKRQIEISWDEACASLRERDSRDTTRAVAPLMIPQGGHVLDTTSMTLDEVVEFIKLYVSKK